MPEPQQSLHVATAYEVETFSGSYVDTSAPDPSTICIEDIAHALAYTCRFGGHSSRFYSVAEHAVRVSGELIDRGCGEYALAGLHHDDAEAYLGDIPRPLKPLLGTAYDDLTAMMNTAIAAALGGLWDVEDLLARPIEVADLWALRMESMALMPSRGDGWNWPTLPWRVFAPNPALGWSPERAEHEFIERHYAIKDLW